MIRPAVREDCATMAEYGLRESDLEELRALGHECPLSALEQSWESSGHDVFTLVVDGKPAAMFGVAPLPKPWPPYTGAPWLLATDRVAKVPFTIAKYTKPWVQWMNLVYPCLVNMALSSNTSTLAWLQRAGFTLLEPEPAGPDGQMFRTFIRRV